MLSVVLQGMGVGIALAAPIGPINIEIVRRGLAGGYLRGWLVGLGAVTADVIYCAVIVTGVAAVVDTRTFRLPLLVAGAVVMAFLGISGLRAAYRGGTDLVPVTATSRSYVTGFLMAVANPFGILYWLSIGAALIAAAVAEAGPGAAPFVVTGVFIGILLWVTVLSGLTQLGRSSVSPRVLRIIGGVGAGGLVAFAVYFLALAIRELG